MNPDFVRGMCIGALAGAAVEVVMLANARPAQTQAHKAMRAMGNAMDDVVDNIYHTFR